MESSVENLTSRRNCQPSVLKCQFNRSNHRHQSTSNKVKETSDTMSQIGDVNKKLRASRRNCKVAKLRNNVINCAHFGIYVLLINLVSLQQLTTNGLQSTSSWTNYQQALNNRTNTLSATIFNTTSVHYEPKAIVTTTLPTATVAGNNLTVVKTTTTTSTPVASSDLLETFTDTSEPADSADSADSADTASAADYSEDEAATTSDGKLVKTLSETASDAADKLVSRLKANRVDGSESSSSTNDGDENEEEEASATEATIETRESAPSDEKRLINGANNALESTNTPTSTANSMLISSKAKITPSNRLARENKLNEAEKWMQIGNNNSKSLAERIEKLRSLELKYALDTYEIWKSSGEDLIELISRKLLPLVMEHGYEVDPVTVTGLLQVFNGLRGLKPWAMKLLDASTKLSPGILLGTQSDFGDYDECLNVRVDDPAGLGLDMSQVELDPATNLPQTTIVGRYCLADVQFPKPPREFNQLQANQSGPIELLRPLYDFAQSASFRDTIWVETGNFFHMLYVDPIRSAICLTNKIDPDSFAQVFNKVFAEFRVSIRFHGRCVTKYDKREWSQFQLVSAWFISIACCLVALSTLVEFFALKLDKIPFMRSNAERTRLLLAGFLERNKLLLTSFSLLRNTKRLFKMPPKFHYKEENVANLHLQQQQQQAGTGKLMGQQQSSSSIANSSSQSSSLESSPQIDRRSSSATSNSVGDLQSTIAGSACQLLSFSDKRGQVSHFKSPTITSYKDQRLDLNCLHGIRVLTMTWMIVNHTYMFGGFFVLWAHRRLIDIAEWPKSLSFQLVLNGWLTVETYFFLSALIIIINVMPLMRAAKFSYVHFIVHRLIRLVPAYAGLVALNFLWPLISSGPVWLVKGRDFIEYPCENYLWTNFVFINNWIWPEKQCMVHTWFLSADFQLYLLAPMIVYLLYKRPVLGHSLNIVIAICASILSGFVIYANNLLPATLINKLEFDSIKQQLSYSYFATYQHMGPYCLGLFVGYILHKRPTIRLPSHLTWLLWLLLPPLSFTTLLLTYLWNGAYKEPSMINPSALVSAFYIAIHRIIWTSLTAWIVFACVTQRAKLLDSFLSHHYFVPISRLSFSIYLVHMPLIMYRALNMRHTKEWTDGNILWEACGNFVTSCLLGYFLNVCFESPFINLEQALFRRKQAQIRTFSNNISETSESSANNSPEIAKREPSKAILQIALADSKSSGQSQIGDEATSSGDNTSQASEMEAKQLSTLVQNELRSIASDFKVKPSLMRSKSTLGRSDLRDDAEDEIYQLESENYHQNPYQLQAQRPRLAFPERAAHYATLARTSRFSQQDMSNILSNRPSKTLSRGEHTPQQQHHTHRLAYNGMIHQHSGQISRRKARYNTLTSARDWTHQQASFKDGAYEYERANHYVSSPNRPGAHSAAWENLTHWNALQNANLAHYMIPRIEPSTLRRPLAIQPARLLHANVTRKSMPIAEEPTTLNDDYHDTQRT